MYVVLRTFIILKTLDIDISIFHEKWKASLPRICIYKFSTSLIKSYQFSLFCDIKVKQNLIAK